MEQKITGRGCLGIASKSHAQERVAEAGLGELGTFRPPGIGTLAAAGSKSQQKMTQ